MGVASARVPRLPRCPDDAAAIEEARQLAGDAMLEIWQGARRVAVITPPKTPQRKLWPHIAAT